MHITYYSGIACNAWLDAIALLYQYTEYSLILALKIRRENEITLHVINVNLLDLSVLYIILIYQLCACLF